MRMRYQVAEGDRGEAHAYCPNLDDMVSPEELSSWVLAHLMKQAEAALQESVTGAVSWLWYRGSRGCLHWGLGLVVLENAA